MRVLGVAVADERLKRDQAAFSRANNNLATRMLIHAGLRGALTVASQRITPDESTNVPEYITLKVPSAPFLDGRPHLRHGGDVP